MTHPALIERITRSLAYMLRHQPEQFDLEVDDFGFAEIEEVVRALNERLGEPVDEEDVERAVTSGDRQRYEFQEGRIRALYGHSISVLPGEPTKPPEELFLGISGRDGERALRSGLRPGRRSFLHLALSEEDARETGRRLAREYTVLTVHALDAWEEGINFYDRKSLFLSDPIPVQYLEEGELYDDGEPPQRDRDSRGPRRRGGRRDDARGEDRGEGDGREPRGRRRGGEERSRDDDRGDRGDRGRGRGRGGRGRREDRPRDDRPRREEAPRREERAQPAASTGTYELKPTARPAAPEIDPSVPFGSGIYEEKDTQTKAKAKARPKAQAKPKPVEPKRTEPEETPSDVDNGFGSGL